MAVICAFGLIFLLRVLVALVEECGKPLPRARKAYWFHFRPKHERGELIVMKAAATTPKFPVKTGHRIALLALVGAGLAIPAHGQQAGVTNATHADVQATAGNQQVSQEILQELEAMRKRIEQLEMQLKQQTVKDPGEAVVSSTKTTAPAPAPSTTTQGQTTQGQTVMAPAALPLPATGLVSQSSPAAAAVSQEETTTNEPFAFADWTWLNGNPRTKEAAFDSKFFTPEIRADVDYTYDFNHPKDDTIGGSSEVFRSNEVNVTQLGVGGDFHYNNVRARLMTQFGLYSETTPRNDASYSRGQWNLADAYRYVSEAYGGYHWDALHGINVDAGIFMSYVGLFSYYNFDNWAYQPSYVSSNTPWFFTGMRIQVFPTAKLKIEPWIINGWQSYARYNGRLGFGGQVLYRPTSWLSMLSNDYGAGADALGIPNRTRYHTDNSIEVKYYDHPERFLDKMAFTLTGDMGCESGGGVSCMTDKKNSARQVVDYKQSFLGYMIYNRWWFHHDRYGFTLGGGAINNPGRYLVLLPPIDGATATSGTPYFTENPGDPFKAWDISATYDYMPSQYITFRWEFNHRHASVPYWSGPGGITPPGGNNGNPGALVCMNNTAGCTGSPTNTWYPDLRRTEDRATMAILVKF